MNTMMRSTLLSAGALSLVYAGIALADGERPGRPSAEERHTRLLERFGDEGIDADGDGTLTRDEVRAFFEAKHGEGPLGLHGGPACGEHGGWGHRGDKMHRQGMALRHLELFSAEAPPAEFTLAKHPEADTDGDGQLSQAEWQAFATQKRGEILARLANHLPNADANGDGTLSEAELDAVKARFREHLLERHSEADTDGDGTLSVEEADAFHAGRMEEHRTRILQRHTEADADGDGALSDAEMHDFMANRPGHGGPHGKGHHGFAPGPEHRTRILEHHPEADADGDGALSDEEIREFRVGFRGQGKPHSEGHGDCEHGPRHARPADN